MTLFNFIQILNALQLSRHLKTPFYLQHLGFIQFQALEKLSALFEMSLKYKHSELHQREIWEAMVEIRHDVSRLKRERLVHA